MRTRTYRIVSAALLALTILAAGFGLIAFNFLHTAVAPPGEQRLLVEPGTPLAAIARQLEQRGVIDSARNFTLLARWQGHATRLQAGEYLFAEAAVPDEILRRLVVGDVRLYRVTFPEGLTMVETAARFSDAGLGSAESVLSLFRDPHLVRQNNIPADSLEGYLFPETYTLRSDTTAPQLVAAMLAQSRAHLSPELLEAAGEHGLNRHQLVILASIIQKEAGDDQEMPLISAVFHNRLQRGMRLQADPTVIYGIAGFDGNLTRKHLATPSPYNTYQLQGLPAGPIANPGEMALRAAAAPAAVNYLYFVARGDGTHQFSTTLAQHNRAVRRFQLGR